MITQESLGTKCQEEESDTPEQGAECGQKQLSKSEYKVLGSESGA